MKKFICIVFLCFISTFLFSQRFYVYKSKPEVILAWENYLKIHKDQSSAIDTPGLYMILEPGLSKPYKFLAHFDKNNICYEFWDVLHSDDICGMYVDLSQKNYDFDHIKSYWYSLSKNIGCKIDTVNKYHYYIHYFKLK